MRAFAVALIGITCIHGSAAAQVDWREELRSDQVIVSGEKFTYTENGVMTIALAGYEEVNLQYQINSEAPASGVISRDNFIGMTAQFSTLIMITAFAEAYDVTAAAFLEGVEFEETEQLIGNPDVRLNLYMTGEGFQIEFIGPDGQPNRFTQTWRQVYGEG